MSFLLVRFLSTIVLLGLIILFNGEPVLVVVGFIVYVIVLVNLGKSKDTKAQDQRLSELKRASAQFMQEDDQRLKDMGSPEPIFHDAERDDSMKRCPYCGFLTRKEAVFCVNCGRKQPEEALTGESVRAPMKHILWPYAAAQTALEQSKAKGRASPILKTFCGLEVPLQDIDQGNPTCPECISKRGSLVSDMLNVLGDSDQ